MLTAKKKASPVTLMAEIAIMAAAGFVLDKLSGAIFRGVFVNGGSIGIAVQSLDGLLPYIADAILPPGALCLQAV